MGGMGAGMGAGGMGGAGMGGIPGLDALLNDPEVLAALQVNLSHTIIWGRVTHCVINRTRKWPKPSRRYPPIRAVI